MKKQNIISNILTQAKEIFAQFDLRRQRETEIFMASQDYQY